MADVKISALPAASSAATTDELPGNQSGTTRKLTVAQLFSATGTLTNKTISGSSNTISNISLTSSVTGTLPVANGGTGAATLTGLVVGNGTSAFTTVTAPSGTVVGTSDAQTLTNKRVDPRVSTTTSASSVTPDVSAYDQYCFTAQAATLTINAPIGTPVDGDKLIFRFLDNGTTRTLSWNATYTAIGVTRPTATTAGKTTYVGCIYNANNTRWDVVAVVTQA